MKSEFGKGLCYCLGLFLAHAERYEAHKKLYEGSGNNLVSELKSEIK